jgi:CRP-like cAMP-binding protein
MINTTLLRNNHTAISGLGRSRRLDGTRLWQSPYLAGEERTVLEGAVTWSRVVDANKDIYQEGEQASDLLFVVDGWAYRYMCTRDGGRQLPALLVPGDGANVDALTFDRLDYSVRALTQVTIAALPRDHAISLAEKHPGIARSFTWLAMLENAIASKWALSIGRRSALARVAHLLCELCVRAHHNPSDGSFYFPLTQEHIGDALGLTSVHVNRTMRQLRAEQLIETSNRMLRIRNIAALRQVGGFDPAYLHMEQQRGTSAC